MGVSLGISAFWNVYFKTSYKKVKFSWSITCRLFFLIFLLHQAAKSHVKSQEELEEAIKQLDDLFPQISAEIMAKFSYVSEVEYVRGENDRISVERPPGPDVNVVETENTGKCFF